PGGPVGSEVEDTAGPVEDEGAVRRLVGRADVDHTDAVTPDAHPVAAVAVDDGVDAGADDPAALDEEVDPVPLRSLAEDLGTEVDGQGGEERQVVGPPGNPRRPGGRWGTWSVQHGSRCPLAGH